MLMPFLELFNTIFNLISLALLIWIILSWLISFDIVNPRQPIVNKVYYALSRLLEPMLKPIRKLLPDLGGIDISPILLIILLRFIQSMMNQMAMSI